MSKVNKVSKEKTPKITVTVTGHEEAGDKLSCHCEAKLIGELEEMEIMAGGVVKALAGAMLQTYREESKGGKHPAQIIDLAAGLRILEAIFDGINSFADDAGIDMEILGEFTKELWSDGEEGRDGTTLS